MSLPGYSLFETPVGRTGIVWTDAGIAGVVLPEREESALRARLLERYPEAREAAPPARVKRAIASIVALLEGKRARLDAIPLDMRHVPKFHRKVYEAARSVPPGHTLSYGALAERVGSPGAARAVGQALKRNPFPLIVPCHRVLRAGGELGGFTAPGGLSTKRRLLELEGVTARRALPRQLELEGVTARRALFRQLELEGVTARHALFRRRSARSLDEAHDGEHPPSHERSSHPTFDAEVALAHLRKADPVLGRLIDRVGPYGLEVERTSNLFAALARSICYQQLNGTAAAAIFGRLRDLFPNKRLSAEALLALPDSALRSAGLSNSKLESLKDLARRTVAGKLPTLAEVRRLPDEAVIERLTVVRGIGRWSVEMLLMFRLGRLDVLPVDDYGIKKGYAIAFKKPKLPSARELEARGLRWRPYRTVASWYLWRAADSRLPT